MTEMIYVEFPPTTTRLSELVNNPPMSVLTADSKAVRWLDAVRREVNKLKPE